MRDEKAQEKPSIFASIGGLAACCGLFYVFTIAGANEVHPLILGSAFGACYFSYRIYCFIRALFPERETPSRIRKLKLFGPAFFTILFGPVVAWGFMVVLGAVDHKITIAAILLGLILTFIVAYIWLNEKT